MEKNMIENFKERNPGREEVLEKIRQFEKNIEVTEELSDENGLYFMITREKDPVDAISTGYTYSRKGVYPYQGYTLRSLVTGINSVYYDGDDVVGGDNISEYDHKNNNWVDNKIV